MKTGTLEKAFAGAKGTVRLDYDGQSITDPALADQVLAELTGIPTEAFFRSTASIRHHELDDLSRATRRRSATASRRRSAARTAARAGRARSSTRRSTSSTTQGRQEPRPAQGRGGRPWTRPGPRWSRARPRSPSWSADRDALAGARERRAEAEADLAERRGLLEKARQAERLIAERDAAQERFERYRRPSR